MKQPEFWEDQAIVERYAELEMDPSMGWYEREVNGPSVKALIPPDAQYVLDFGCGPGVFTAELGKQFARAEGLDSSAAMIAKARALHPHVRFHHWDFREPLSNDLLSYDAMVVKQTAEYIKELDVFASAATRLLAPGGSLVLSVLHPSCTAPFVPDYWKTTQYKTPVSKYGIYPSPIHRSQEALVAPFVTAGFVLRELVEPKPDAALLARYETDAEAWAEPIRLNMRFEKARIPIPVMRWGAGPARLQHRIGR